MENEKEIGIGWLKVSKQGKNFVSGVIDVDKLLLFQKTGKMNFVMFSQEPRGKGPTHRILYSLPMQQKQQGKGF
jgi:hypothetical protein